MKGSKSMNFAERIETEEQRKILQKEHALRSISATKEENKMKDEMMSLASDYYNSGKSLDELDDKIKNHYYFKVGYERAKRLALIASLDEKESRKQR